MFGIGPLELLVLPPLIAVYMLPTIISASSGGHGRRLLAIAAVNLLTGWTVIGYAVALVMVFRKPAGES